MRTKQRISTIVCAGLLAIANLPATATAVDPGSTGGVEERARHAQEPMSISIEPGNVLRIRGGVPGSLCVLLVGFELRPIALPGGAWLCVQPLAVALLGRFDDTGQFQKNFDSDGREGDGVSFYAQAVSVTEGDTTFLTSSVLEVVGTTDGAYIGTRTIHCGEDDPPILTIRAPTIQARPVLRN